MGKKKKKLLE